MGYSSGPGTGGIDGDEGGSVTGSTGGIGSFAGFSPSYGQHGNSGSYDQRGLDPYDNEISNNQYQDAFGTGNYSAPTTGVGWLGGTNQVGALGSGAFSGGNALANPGPMQGTMQAAMKNVNQTNPMVRAFQDAFNTPNTVGEVNKAFKSFIGGNNKAFNPGMFNAGIVTPQSISGVLQGVLGGTTPIGVMTNIGIKLGEKAVTGQGWKTSDTMSIMGFGLLSGLYEAVGDEGVTGVMADVDNNTNALGVMGIAGLWGGMKKNGYNDFSMEEAAIESAVPGSISGGAGLGLAAEEFTGKDKEKKIQEFKQFLVQNNVAHDDKSVDDAINGITNNFLTPGIEPYKPAVKTNLLSSKKTREQAEEIKTRRGLGG